MKQALLTWTLALLATALHAQNETYLLRASVDNDILNITGQGTDEAYSNGGNLNFFYVPAHRSHFFLDSWMPYAGDSSVNVYGIGFNHVIYTPADLNKDSYTPHDYNYAGAMYLTHSLYSYDPVRKYDLQTELLAGVIGPASQDKPFQRTFHNVIHDKLPMGWDNQFNNDILLNLGFTAESQIAAAGNYLLLLGAARVQAGTMRDAADLAPELRIGRMNPYFSGYLGQRSGEKLQAYAWVRPGLQVVGYDAMLQGGMFSPLPMVKMYDGPADAVAGPQYQRISRPEIERTVPYIAFGMVVAYRRLSLSYTQTRTSQLVKDTYLHTYGNLTAAYSW